MGSSLNDATFIFFIIVLENSWSLYPYLCIHLKAKNVYLLKNFEISCTLKHFYDLFLTNMLYPFLCKYLKARTVYLFRILKFPWLLNIFMNFFTQLRENHKVVDRGSLSHISNMNFQFWAVLGCFGLFWAVLGSRGCTEKYENFFGGFHLHLLVFPIVYQFNSTLLYKVPLKYTGKNFVKTYTAFICRIYNEILL